MSYGGCGERAREGGGLREGRERGRSSLGGRTKARRVTGAQWRWPESKAAATAVQEEDGSGAGVPPTVIGPQGHNGRAGFRGGRASERAQRASGAVCKGVRAQPRGRAAHAGAGGQAKGGGGGTTANAGRRGSELGWPARDREGAGPSRGGRKRRARARARWRVARGECGGRTREGRTTRAVGRGDRRAGPRLVADGAGDRGKGGRGGSSRGGRGVWAVSAGRSDGLGSGSSGSRATEDYNIFIA